MYTSEDRFTLNSNSDTYRLRELGRVYFTTIETLSDIANITVRAAEVLLFIFNFNRTYRKCPSKKKIELHLNFNNVKKHLESLNKHNLIKTVNQKYYLCTEQADITDIDRLAQYTVALHSIDDWSAETFLEFMTFVHSIETMNGLETPITSRRTLARCFCLCDEFKVTDVCKISNKKVSACMYARDLKKVLPIIEHAFHQDTFYLHVRDVDRRNAIQEHQCSQFAKARAYVFDYEVTNKKTHHTYTTRSSFKKQLDEETLEIADKAIEQLDKMSADAICVWLYQQIVTKKISEYSFKCLSESVYWSDKSECETENNNQAQA